MKRVRVDVMVDLVFIPLLLVAVIFLTFPLFVDLIDDSRADRDRVTARAMTDILSGHDLLFSTGHDIRAIISDADPDVGFIPLSSDSGFFYLSDEQRVVHMTYEDALDHIANFNPVNTGYRSPEELFGPGVHLLTGSGHIVADVVSFIYGQTGSASNLTKYHEDLEAIMTVDEKFLGTYAGTAGPSEKLMSRLEHLVDYFDPSETLFVGNQGWRTSASFGDRIRHIVFAQGIHTIPSFPNRAYETKSITFGSITLPKTVERVDEGAFNHYFDIQTLRFVNDLSHPPGTNAFVGVRHVIGLNPLLYRDDPGFEIRDLLNGEPLVTYVEDMDDVVTFDTTNLYRYFVSLQLTILNVEIVYNENEPELSRVYVHTSEGYHGYVVPVETTR